MVPNKKEFYILGFSPSLSKCINKVLLTKLWMALVLAFQLLEVIGVIVLVAANICQMFTVHQALC